RLFRTGDLMRCRWDGELEIAGRRDRQVKVRGYRIAPEEIESELRRAGATTAVVAARGDHLAAYVEIGGQPLAAIQSAAMERLPPYMRPAEWIETQDWRHAASGKIDPRWLPMSDLPPGDRPGPQGETEKALADIYGEILGLESVSRETDFFAAGGHSLLAVQLVAGIQNP